MSYKGGITSHPGKEKTMTQKEILWYALQGARSYLLYLTETMEDIDKLTRRLNDIRAKELEEQEAQQ